MASDYIDKERGGATKQNKTKNKNNPYEDGASVRKNSLLIYS